MKLVLRKYHCMGNDYLVYDTGKNAMELTESRIRSCATGISASGPTGFWPARSRTAGNAICAF